MRLKSGVIKYFDNFTNYDVYYKGPWKYYRQRCTDITRAFCHNKRSIRVLDLGCGRIPALPGLLSDSNVIEYHCVDSSCKSLEVLRDSVGGNTKVEIYESDIIEFVNSCTGSYDLIILFGVIMYLTRPDVTNLFYGLNKILSKKGLILIHEPNQKAGRYLDQYGYPMTYEFLTKILSNIENGHIKKMESHNIIGFRRPVSLLVRMLRKSFERVGVKNRIIVGMVNWFEDSFWYFESLIETALHKTRLGCDWLIFVEK